MKFGKNICVCGPPTMMDAVAGFLSDLHVNEKSTKTLLHSSRRAMQRAPP
jgi:NAD(P)H-flavin reductase